MNKVSVPPELAEDRLLTVAEFSATVKVCRSNIYREMDEGRLRSVKIGGARRIPLQAAKAYLSSLKGGSLVENRQGTLSPK